MTTRLLSLLLLVGMGLSVGCRENPLPLPFQFVQTHEILLAETDPLEVNNCGNILTRPYVQWYNDPLGSAGVSNLTPTGGEPFSWIHDRMIAVYGKQAQPFFILDVPPDTHRVYTFHIETTRYRGEVTGEVINANKIHQNTPAFYSYYLRRGVVLSGHEDIPCP